MTAPPRPIRQPPASPPGDRPGGPGLPVQPGRGQPRPCAGASPWLTVPVTLAVAGGCARGWRLLARGPGRDPAASRSVAVVLQEGREAAGPRPPAGPGPGAGTRPPAPRPGPRGAPPRRTPRPPTAPAGPDSQAVPDAVPAGTAQGGPVPAITAGLAAAGAGRRRPGRPAARAAPGQAEAAGGPRPGRGSGHQPGAGAKYRPPPPAYPPLARSARIQGTVVVADPGGPGRRSHQRPGPAGPVSAPGRRRSLCPGLALRAPPRRTAVPMAARFQLDYALQDEVNQTETMLTAPRPSPHRPPPLPGPGRRPAGPASGPGPSGPPLRCPTRASSAMLLFLLALQLYIAVERGFVYAQSNAATRPFLKLFLAALRQRGFRGGPAGRHRPQPAATWPWCSSTGWTSSSTRSSSRASTGGHDVIQPVERAIARGSAEVGDLLQARACCPWPPSAPWRRSSACWAR